MSLYDLLSPPSQAEEEEGLASGARAGAGDLSGMGPGGGGGISRVSLSTLLAEAETPDSDDGAEAVSSPLSCDSSLFTV